MVVRRQNRRTVALESSRSVVMIVMDTATARAREDADGVALDFDVPSIQLSLHLSPPWATY